MLERERKTENKIVKSDLKFSTICVSLLVIISLFSRFLINNEILYE